MKKISHPIILSALLLSLTLPLVTFAVGVDYNVIKPYSQGLIDLINKVFVPLLMAIAFFVFLWGVYKYFIWGAENELDKAEGRKFTMWGIIGFVIILSLWALVALVRGTFGFTGTTTPPAPPTIGGGTA